MTVHPAPSPIQDADSRPGSFIRQAATSGPDSPASGPYSVLPRTPDRSGVAPSQAAPRAPEDHDGDTADGLLDQYERIVLPSLPPVPNGTYTVEFADGRGYVTFLIERSWKYPGAQVALAKADSRNSLSFEGRRLLGMFSIVRGRRAWPDRDLMTADDIPELWKPFRRLLMGLDAALRSSDPTRYLAVRCVVCEGELTTPESIRRRVGPECERYLEERG